MKVGFDCNVMVRTGCHKKVFRLPYLYLKKKSYPEFNVYL